MAGMVNTHPFLVARACMHAGRGCPGELKLKRWTGTGSWWSLDARPESSGFLKDTAGSLCWAITCNCRALTSEVWAQTLCQLEKVAVWLRGVQGWRRTQRGTEQALSGGTLRQECYQRPRRKGRCWNKLCFLIPRCHCIVPGGQRSRPPKSQMLGFLS